MVIAVRVGMHARNRVAVAAPVAGLAIGPDSGMKHRRFLSTHQAGCAGLQFARSAFRLWIRRLRGPLQAMRARRPSGSAGACRASRCRACLRRSDATSKPGKRPPTCRMPERSARPAPECRFGLSLSVLRRVSTGGECGPSRAKAISHYSAKAPRPAIAPVQTPVRAEAPGGRAAIARARQGEGRGGAASYRGCRYPRGIADFPPAGGRP